MSNDFEAIKAGKMAIWPRLVCQCNENMFMDPPSSVLKIVSIAITAKPPQGVVGTYQKELQGWPYS